MKENKDEKYIIRCFEIAKYGKNSNRTNPQVGAILVYRDTIISEGYHEYFGGPHAEVNCLKDVQDKEILQNSTLYISLEPCNHSGKTPPCTNLIVEKQIPRVVVGSLDFNKQVNGRGIKMLEDNGVEVVNLNLDREQRELNTSFYINQTLNRPLFIGKVAISNDNYIGREGEQVKITSIETNTLMHQLRAESDAILIGKNTYENDKPKLTTRLFPGKNPDVVLLYNELESKPIIELKTDNVLIFNKNIAEVQGNTSFTTTSSNALSEIARDLYSMNYGTVLVEGGKKILESFDREDIFDFFIQIRSQNVKIGEGVEAPKIDFSKYELLEIKKIKSDLISIYRRNDLFSR